MQRYPTNGQVAIKSIGQFDFTTGVSFEKFTPDLQKYTEKVNLVMTKDPYKNGSISKALHYIKTKYASIGIDVTDVEREYHRKNRI